MEIILKINSNDMLPNVYIRVFVTPFIKDSPWSR